MGNEEGEQSSHRKNARPGDILLHQLDAWKFATNAAVVFGGMTTALYPLSCIKTNAMVQQNASTLRTARSLLGQSYLAPWRGFGTVLVGMFPSRALYLTSLEAGRSHLRSLTGWAGLSPSLGSSIADAASAASASVVSQCVSVPIDVVAQRQMVSSSPTPAVSVLRELIRADGVVGLWRGMGASLLTVAPSSMIWWASYGTYQSLLWQMVLSPASRSEIEAWEATGRTGHAPNSLMGLQALSGFCSGCTSGALTTPMDVAKARLQTRRRSAHTERPSLAGIIRELYKQEGWRGFTRGLSTRMAASALWSTSAITMYELIKRMSVQQRSQAEPNFEENKISEAY